ncbi:elongation factor Ts [Sporobacter termitidis DSM 10068]|uniref:Elongation factor Ts n=1 Tax=Sporobacter termitidis DSM 10068 TaxID=1123282 RepID=A0A1M5TQZ1_9FIRM|nr:translation elongation factor Ts [Sporobacter termitidis]SHH53016.1 elongation factor Ts [Sporobacter termitidis DSM 10068]
MAFTAQDVKDLREMTGVGMMDCKKALTESDGDMQKAIDWLREKGLAAAQKKAGRVAAEGIAYAAVIDNVGIVVEVNAETDFVAQNEKFVDFVKNVAAAAAKNAPADLEALLDSKYPGSDKTVREMQQEMVLVIGENISVRRFARYTTGLNVPYVHAGGKIGVLVNMEVANISNTDAVVTLGKDIAMQIAAMRPLYLDPASVDTGDLEKEREIQLHKAIEENKAKNLPDDKARQIAENMVKGRINKYYEDICLLNQPYVKENKVTVEQHVKQVAKELGGTIAVKAFTRFEKGEGIEKKQENFAEEISKLVK